LCFSVFGVRAVFVLLTANTILDKSGDLVFYIRKLVVSLDEFYCSGDSRVTVKRVVIVAADYLFLQSFGYLCWYLFIKRNLHKVVKLLGWS
jgi:hypothetical protein